MILWYLIDTLIWHWRALAYFFGATVYIYDNVTLYARVHPFFFWLLHYCILWGHGQVCEIAWMMLGLTLTCREKNCSDDYCTEKNPHLFTDKMTRPITTHTVIKMPVKLSDGRVSSYFIFGPNSSSKRWTYMPMCSSQYTGWPTK